MSPFVISHTFWPGHTGRIIIVRRWRRCYRWFNLLFARATREPEWIIETYRSARRRGWIVGPAVYRRPPR